MIDGREAVADGVNLTERRFRAGVLVMDERILHDDVVVNAEVQRLGDAVIPFADSVDGRVRVGRLSVARDPCEVLRRRGGRYRPVRRCGDGLAPPRLAHEFGADAAPPCVDYALGVDGERLGSSGVLARDCCVTT